MLRLFLDFRASPDVKDSTGRTPLHVAMSVGSERSAWVLLSRGKSDYTIVDDEGQSALVEALIRLWSRPEDEAAARNASLLAQCAGAEHLALAKASVTAAIKKRLHSSLALVSLSRDGDCTRIAIEIRQNLRTQTPPTAMASLHWKPRSPAATMQL